MIQDAMHYPTEVNSIGPKHMINQIQLDNECRSADSTEEQHQSDLNEHHQRDDLHSMTIEHGKELTK